MVSQWIDEREDEEYEQQDEEEEWTEYLRERRQAIVSAKRRTRSELNPFGKDWSRGGYSDSNILDISDVKDTTPRIPVSSLTREEWLEKYEKTRTPVILTGITKGWKAPKAWTIKNLNATYGDTKFKIGEDDEGNSVRMNMRHFLEYCEDEAQAGSDDSPLYIFDSNFGNPSIHRMLGDFEVPHFFTEDLLQYVGEDMRPAYRWVVIGPARSGTWLHLDPLYTSAWNTLISGTKRWILFPPTTPRNLVSPTLKVDQEAVSWFRHVYPQTQKPSWPYDKPIEIIQRAGETIYVPGGWWHAVLNLDMTVAVTQNYANSVNFPMVWTHSVKGRPYMAKKWLQALRRVRPDMAAVADHIQRFGCPQCETEIDDEDDAPGPEEGDYEEDEKDNEHKQHSTGIRDEEEGEEDEEDEEEGQQHRRHHSHDEEEEDVPQQQKHYSLNDQDEEEGTQHRRNRYHPIEEDEEEEVMQRHTHHQVDGDSIVRPPRDRRMKLPLPHSLRDVQSSGGRTLTGIQPGRGAPLAGQQVHDAHALAAGGMPHDLHGQEPFLVSHGTLMITSWILLFPLAVLLARHKWVLGDRKLRWMHLVFHLLRVIQVLGFLTMTAGLFIALTSFHSPSTEVGKLHFFVGAVVFTLTSLRALGSPGGRPESPSHLARERVHSWLWHLLPVAGFANVFIGIHLMDEITEGYYPYSMWVVPICVIAGVLLAAELVLSNMKSARGVRDPVSKPPAGFSQDGKVNRGQNLMNSELHFRAARHGITASLE